MRHFANIAQTLKRIRIEKGLTQQGVSKSLGYKHGQFMSNIERGLAGLPFHMIANMCEVLDCGPEDIIEAMSLDYKSKLNYEYHNPSQKNYPRQGKKRLDSYGMAIPRVQQ